MSEYVTAWTDDLPGMTHGEEIVRCRDCKHLRRDDPWFECHRAGFYVGAVDGSEPDGFCAWGEKVNE